MYRYPRLQKLAHQRYTRSGGFRHVQHNIRTNSRCVPHKKGAPNAKECHAVDFVGFISSVYVRCSGFLLGLRMTFPSNCSSNSIRLMITSRKQENYKKPVNCY